MPNGARGVISWLAPLLVTACVVPEGSEDGGAGRGPETLTSRFGDGGPRSCGPLGNLTGITPSCQGFEDYTACVERECLDGYDVCLGSDWPSGDYSDGSCSDLMECIASSPDPCEHACELGGACQDCLVGQLSICETYCAELVDCSSAGDDPVAPSGGPCGALSACCNGLDASMREICVLEQQDAVSGGDSACEVLLLRYCP